MPDADYHHNYDYGCGQDDDDDCCYIIMIIIIVIVNIDSNIVITMFVIITISIIIVIKIIIPCSKMLLRRKATLMWGDSFERCNTKSSVHGLECRD